MTVDEIVNLKALRNYLKAFAGAVYQNAYLPAAPDAAAADGQGLIRGTLGSPINPIPSNTDSMTAAATISTPSFFAAARKSLLR
ncbi:MAG: hypothetical protein AABM64_07255 [Pseudomonadota bacterium]